MYCINTVMAAVCLFTTLNFVIFTCEALTIEHEKGPITLNNITERIRNPIEIDLWKVGMYMAAHKYFGVDFRYQVGIINAEDQIMYRKFPTPTLRELHDGLSNACAKSAMECVKVIIPIAEKSGTLQYFFNKAPENKEEKKSLLDSFDEKASHLLDPWAPFKNSYEMFKFRQTAAYFMCFHTLFKDEYLHFETTGVTCLEFLNHVDEIPEKKRKNLMTELNPIIVDIRDALFRTDPLTCARLWFCPDPCYGRKTAGNYNHTGFQSPGNPCIDLKNKECNWKPKSNHNFDGLMKNKFNITCHCAAEKKGFEWNSRFALCVDKDECFDKKHTCSFDRVCLNTVGSYICACPRGFKVNPENERCEKLSIIHEGAIIMEVKTGLGHTIEEDRDILDELMEFFGLSAASTTQLSFSLFHLLFLLQYHVVF